LLKREEKDESFSVFSPLTYFQASHSTFIYKYRIFRNSEMRNVLIESVQSSKDPILNSSNIPQRQTNIKKIGYDNDYDDYRLRWKYSFNIVVGESLMMKKLKDEQCRM
jgi:hypothetical protein